MKRKLFLGSALVPALLATGAMGQVVNFHDDNNGGPMLSPLISANQYDALFAGQGAYSDPGNNIWNGFGNFNAGMFQSTYFYCAGPGGSAPWPQPSGNPGNPYAAYSSGSGWVSSSGPNLFSFPTASLTESGNASSAGQWSPVTLKVGGYSGDTSIDPQYVPNGTPEFLLSSAAYRNGTNSTETFTLQHVPAGVYGLYLYGANPDNNRGTAFAVNSGTAHNGISATLNNMQDAPAVSFVEGQNYVIFENVTPDSSGDITITAKPNALDGVGNDNLTNETDVVGLQLIFNPPPTAQGYTVAQNVLSGGTASFSFTPVFAASPTFKWQYVKGGVTNNLSDGGSISGSGTSSLTVANATTANAGFYQCVISTATATNTSPAAPLTIISTTTILQNGDPITAVGSFSNPGDVLTDMNNAAPGDFYGYLPMNITPPDFNLSVTNVEDGNLLQYINLGGNGQAAPFSGPAGFTVSPALGSTVVKGIRFYTSSSHPEDDPADFLLQGSTDGGTTFTPIAGGLLHLPAQRNAPYGAINITNQVFYEVDFNNSLAYNAYQLTFTNVADDNTASNGVQLAEVQFLGSLPPVPPGILTAPNATNDQLAGSSLDTSIAAFGPGPFTYQWYFNTTTAISGATNAAFTLTNVQAVDAGSYMVKVTSPYGSTNATLVLNVAATTPYQKALESYSPLGYWPLNEAAGPTAYDQINGYNGTYTGTSFTFLNPGVPDAGFGSPSYSVFMNSGSYIDVPEGPFDFTGPLTLIVWVQLSSASTFEDVIGHGDSSYRMSVNPSGQPGFACGTDNQDATSSSSIADGNWHMLTGVYAGGSGATANGFLYVDGVLVASNSITALPQNKLDLWIGGAPDYGTSRTFDGNLCQVAVIPQGLSGAQVEQLFGSGGVPPTVTVQSSATIDEGGNGSVTGSAIGTLPLAYQWTYAYNGSTTTISGATNATLQLTDVQLVQASYSYYLVVTNLFGAVTSSAVTINVATQPVLVTDISPLLAQVPAGAPIKFSVGVTGAEPIHYQWSNGVTAIQGATNSSYSFNAPAGTNSFTVGIFNSLGAISSSTAVVEAGPAPLISFNDDGTNWYLTEGSGFLPAISNDVLTLTDNQNGQTGTAFYAVPQYVGGFVAEFIYQASGNKGADGVTFCLQNDATNATGAGGGSLGIVGITNSFALELNIYSGDHGGTGYLFQPDGQTPDSAPAGLNLAFLTAAPVNLASGDPIAIQLYYSQNVISMWMTDTTNGNTFSTTLATNVPAAITSSTAWVGFTGATGGVNSIQTITGFAFSFTTPPVLSVAKGVTGSLIVSWPDSVASLFMLQQSANVNGPWLDVPVPPQVVNANYQVTVSPGATAAFYRLSLQ